MYNRTTRVKRGETGFVIDVTLYDDTGATQSLTSGGAWSVAIEVTAVGSALNLLEGTAMVVKNQTTYPGQCYYTMTANDALLAAATYDLEIIATTPTGRIVRFPKDEGSTFGKLIMMPSKVG